jgi:hypothetical protein
VRVGPIEEPLDGGASTHRWARESARGPAVRHTKERARVRREIGGR